MPLRDQFILIVQLWNHLFLITLQSLHSFSTIPLLSHLYTMFPTMNLRFVLIHPQQSPSLNQLPSTLLEDSLVDSHLPWVILVSPCLVDPQSRLTFHLTLHLRLRLHPHLVETMGNLCMDHPLAQDWSSMY